MSFDPGDVWTPELTVKNAEGTLVAATVVLTVTSPSGVISTPTPTTGSTGIYTANVPLTEAGRWLATWTVSGTVTGSESQNAYVRAAPLPVSVADIKLRLNKTLSVDDAEIESMLDAAVAEYTEKVGPLPGAVTEYFDGGGQRLVLASANATAITAASYGSGTTISPSDLTVRNGIVDWAYGSAGRFSYGGGQVAITYTVGSLPANHREAIIADVAGYFSATQRGGGAGPSFAGEGYEAPVSLNPLVLFPRINALASAAIA